jgi:hypothetical protein
MEERKKSQEEESKVRKIVGSSREDFAEGIFTELELHWDRRIDKTGTSPRQRNLTVGGVPTIIPTLQNG